MEQNKKIGYKDIFKQKEYMKMMVAALINRMIADNGPTSETNETLN